MAVAESQFLDRKKPESSTRPDFGCGMLLQDRYSDKLRCLFGGDLDRMSIGALRTRHIQLCRTACQEFNASAHKEFSDCLRAAVHGACDMANLPPPLHRQVQPQRLPQVPASVERNFISTACGARLPARPLSKSPCPPPRADFS